MEKTRIPKYPIGHKWRLTENLAITYHFMLRDGRGFHREDGPAVTWLMDGGWCYEWWLHGKRHRLDGPAVESPDGSKSWWVNGERVSREWMSVLRVKPDEVEGKKE